MRSDFHDLPYAAKMAIRRGEMARARARSGADAIAGLEATLTRKQALIEEMVEGLNVYGDHLDRCGIYLGRGCDCGLAGLITKATEDK